MTLSVGNMLATVYLDGNGKLVLIEAGQGHIYGVEDANIINNFDWDTQEWKLRIVVRLKEIE